jgi:hypothetical protein
MKKYVALSLLVMTALGVVVSHLDVQHLDDSYLLLVDAVPVDVRGHVSAALNQATRRCDGITKSLSGDLLSDAKVTAVKEAISGYSPPDSHRLKLRQLLSSGPWVLAEVEFAQLQPAVIVLEQNANGMVVYHHSIWSGSMWPWEAGPWIRRYLRQSAPQVPSALWACYDPSPALFNLR